MGVVVGLAVLGVVLFGAAWWLDRRRRLYTDTSTTPAAAVFIGHNEVKGRAWSETPVTSHLTRTSSVEWSYVLQEEREHTRTVTDTDSKGNTTTRTETYRQWHDIDNKSGGVATFEVIDDTGSARVATAGATVIPRVFKSHTFRREVNRFFDKRTGRYQEIERGIAVGDDLFIAGTASLDEETVTPVFSAAEDRLLVSTRSEESHRNKLGFFAPVFAVGAVAALGGASARAIDGSGIAQWLPGLAVGALLIVLAVAVITFNRLKLVGQQALRAWSLVDVQLSRRHDLIPNLARIAQAHASHEGELALYTSMVRSGVDLSMTSATSVSGSDVVDTYERGAEQAKWIRNILALQEDYPELTSDASFLEVQHQIADAESRIASARTFYNDNVTMLADRSGAFPGALIARFVELPSLELFDARGFERTVPEIDMSF